MDVLRIARRRGQPLLVLCALLAGWIGLRVTLLARTEVASSPVGAPKPNVAQPMGRPARHAIRFADDWSPPSLAADQNVPRWMTRSARQAWPDMAPLGKEGRPIALPAEATSHEGLITMPSAQPASGQGASAEQSVTGGISDHVFAQDSQRMRHGTRWSGDAWLLQRDRTGAASLAATSGAYGGSQAGAVLRYALAPDSRWQPVAYGRLATALGGIVDRQAALGLSLRPLRRVPVTVLAEARVQQGSIATHVRPAVAMTGGFGPSPVGAGLTVDGYGQAGWVGGSDATPFFDLQASAVRHVLAVGHAGDLSLGVGAWSGGQHGASRLDLGPRLQWQMAPGGLQVRVMLDWRFRAAGNAQPGSGPALTIASGF